VSLYQIMQNARINEPLHHFAQGITMLQKADSAAFIFTFLTT